MASLLEKIGGLGQQVTQKVQSLPQQFQAAGQLIGQGVQQFKPPQMPQFQPPRTPRISLDSFMPKFPQIQMPNLAQPKFGTPYYKGLEQLSKVQPLAQKFISGEGIPDILKITPDQIGPAQGLPPQIAGPAMLGAGILNVSRKLLPKLTQVKTLAALNGLKNFETFTPTKQIQIDANVQKIAKELIPNVINSKEMRKLSISDPATWRKTIYSFLQTRLSEAKNPIPDIGLSIKKVGGEPFQPNLPPQGQNIPPSVTSQQIYQPSTGIISDPVNKIINALKAAKPIRAKQEAIYSAERGEKAAKIAAIGEKVPGEAGFHAQLGALKGPLSKVEFESLKGQIQQPDIDNLFQQVEDFEGLLPFQKITAKEGLSKILGARGGSVPTEGELKLLDQVFPPEFIQAVLDKRSTLQKLWGTAEDTLSLPRALMSSGDFSASFRQAVFAAPSHPKTFAKAFVGQFKQAFSERAFQEVQTAIKARPTYALMDEYGLALTDTGKFLNSKEEAFASSLAGKLPFIGKFIRASERTYIGFLNKFRADLFDDLLAKNPQLKDDARYLGDMADLINNMTGRGKLPGEALQKAGPLLNGVFFSPKLMASRLNLLIPIRFMTAHPQVRKEYLKSLFAFASTGLTILGLAKLAGADIGIDARSADFGKIKIGNTRFDLWGGFQQYIKLAAQLMTGQLVSSTTGKVFTSGEGFRPLTREDILSRFATNKTAPIFSFALDLLRQQTGIGEELTFNNLIAQRFVPMVAQDIYDAYKEYGEVGLGVGIPAMFGIGAQTYGYKLPKKLQEATVGMSKEEIETITEEKLKQVQEEGKNEQIIRELKQELEPKKPSLLDRFLPKVGAAEEASNLDPVRQRLKADLQEKLAREKVKLQGGLQETDTSYFYTEGGSTKELLKDRPIYEPKLSGNSELDKLELKKQSTSYTNKISDIQTKYRLDLLSAEEAEKEITKLQTDQKSLKTRIKTGRGKGKKVKLGPAPKIRIPKVTIPKVKLSQGKIKSAKIRIPKFNIKIPKSRISGKARLPKQTKVKTAKIKMKGFPNIYGRQAFA